MPEKPPENHVKGLNLLDAVGPSFFQNRPATGECFAPLVAQAAQVASAQPERLSILPKQVHPKSVGCVSGGEVRTGTCDPQGMIQWRAGGVTARSRLSGGLGLGSDV